MTGEHRPPRRPSPQPGSSGDGDFFAETFASASAERDATGRIPRVGDGSTESINPPTSPAIVAPEVASQWVAPDYRKRTTTGDRFSSALPGTARKSLEAIGGLYSMMAASLYGLG